MQILEEKKIQDEIIGSTGHLASFQCCLSFYSTGLCTNGWVRDSHPQCCWFVLLDMSVSWKVLSEDWRRSYKSWSCFG